MVRNSLFVALIFITHKPGREKNRHSYRESQNKVVPSHRCPLRPSERPGKRRLQDILEKLSIRYYFAFSQKPRKLIGNNNVLK